MKKAIITTILITSLLFTACVNNETLDFNSSYDGLSVIGYGSLEDIYDRSELVVQIELSGKSIDVKHENAALTLSEAIIKDVLMGDPDMVNKVINIIELSQINMTDYEDGKRFVLFLHPYNGDTFEDGYFISGVYQGKLKLDHNNNIIYDAHRYGGLQTFQTNINQLSLNDFRNKLLEFN